MQRYGFDGLPSSGCSLPSRASFSKQILLRFFHLLSEDIPAWKYSRLFHEHFPCRAPAETRARPLVVQITDLGQGGIHNGQNTRTVFDIIMSDPTARTGAPRIHRDRAEEGARVGRKRMDRAFTAGKPDRLWIADIR